MSGYQLQFASANTTKIPAFRRYFHALGLPLNTFEQPLLVGDCPICSSKESMLISPETQAFRCTGCGSHDNGLVQLHAQLYRITTEQAREQLVRMAEVSA